MHIPDAKIYTTRMQEGFVGAFTMVKLTPEMKEAFLKMKVFPVATASKDGVPNVVPVGIVELVSDDTIWITDNFMTKTLNNIKANPKIALFVWGPEIKGCFQIKGLVTLKTNGKEYDEMKAKLNVKNPALPARSLLIVKITDVYECKPGPTAGVKIL